MNKWVKAGILLIAVLLAAFVGMSAYLGCSMTRQDRVALERDPGSIGLAYEDVSFPSMDTELTLRGWLLPCEGSDELIIIVHGNGNNRDDRSIGIMDIAAALVTYGYNVLMFDLRGCGESDGNMVSGGYYEQKDLEGAVRYAGELGFDTIGVLGFSLGAVTTLITAADNEEIDAVVSDSSYADLTDIMETEFTKRTSAPSFLLKPILFMIKLMYGVDFAAIRPVESVGDIAPTPILFIHGEEDETIPVEHASRLYKASQNTLNQLWITPGTGHVRSYINYPEEYISRITAFFDRAFR